MHRLRIVRGLLIATAGSLLVVAKAEGQMTTRVSVSSSGQQASGLSGQLTISADGMIVAFTSLAPDLVAGDTNNLSDVFVHDRGTGVTERVSVDSNGNQGDNNSSLVMISADGRFVAFSSVADNLVPNDTNANFDVFVNDRSTGAVERVSVDSSGNEGDDGSVNPSISADGRYVAFESTASNLVAGDTNNEYDVFVHDRTTGVTERVSVSSSGGEGNGFSTSSAISADGGLVAFDSEASNLVVGDTNSTVDVFVHDRATGVTERVSVHASGNEGNGLSGAPSVSSDLRFVAFQSLASNLVAGDQNASMDIFVKDRTTALVERVSVSSTGLQGNRYSYFPSISADGGSVAFYSLATNLVHGDANNSSDVFVHDRTTGATLCASVDSSGVEGDADSAVYAAALSADGNAVGFESSAGNLVAGDTNGVQDVFVHERCSSAASWSNYGIGFPGTFGVPSLTSQQNPVFGTTITIDLANSLQAPTAGLLLVGFQRTLLSTNRGGDLLVVPALLVPIAFSSGGDSFSGTIPDDVNLCGFILDLQGIEADPGAAFGISFTPGLELVLGV